MKEIFKFETNITAKFEMNKKKLRTNESKTISWSTVAPVFWMRHGHSLLFLIENVQDWVLNKAFWPDKCLCVHYQSQPNILSIMAIPLLISAGDLVGDRVDVEYGKCNLCVFFFYTRVPVILHLRMHDVSDTPAETWCVSLSRFSCSRCCMHEKWSFLLYRLPAHSHMIVLCVAPTSVSHTYD